MLLPAVENLDEFQFFFLLFIVLLGNCHETNQLVCRKLSRSPVTILEKSGQWHLEFIQAIEHPPPS